MKNCNLYMVSGDRHTFRYETYGDWTCVPSLNCLRSDSKTSLGQRFKTTKSRKPSENCSMRPYTKEAFNYLFVRVNNHMHEGLSMEQNERRSKNGVFMVWNFRILYVTFASGAARVFSAPQGTLWSHTETKGPLISLHSICSSLASGPWYPSTLSPTGGGSLSRLLLTSCPKLSNPGAGINKTRPLYCLKHIILWRACIHKPVEEKIRKHISLVFYKNNIWLESYNATIVKVFN